MVKQKLSAKEAADDERIRRLIRLARSSGLEIRRERLARGNGFRVKSGDCVYKGERVFFVDRRLPLDQQLSVIIDYVNCCGMRFPCEEIEFLPKKMQSLLQRSLGDAA